MTEQVRLRKAGGSLTATLPKDITERLRLRAGDRLTVVETDEGILLKLADPEFEAAMQAFEHVARQYRNALRELAK